MVRSTGTALPRRRRGVGDVDEAEEKARVETVPVMMVMLCIQVAVSGCRIESPCVGTKEEGRDKGTGRCGFRCEAVKDQEISSNLDKTAGGCEEGMPVIRKSPSQKVDTHLTG